MARALALAEGFEPPTHCLQGSCSAPELRQRSQNFTLFSRSVPVKQLFSSARQTGYVGGVPPARRMADLCRTISKHKAADADETFSDRSLPRMGRVRRKSHRLATRGLTPSPSPPRTRQRGRVRSTSQGAWPPDSAVPAIQIDLALMASKALTRLASLATGTSSMAPMAARATPAVSPAAW